MEPRRQRPSGQRIGGSSFPPCGRPCAETHARSARLLPTELDYVGGPCARSTDNRVINRRFSPFGRCLLGSPNPAQPVIAGAAPRLLGSLGPEPRRVTGNDRRTSEVIQ
jgi:hypothetical protein